MSAKKNLLGWVGYQPETELTNEEAATVQTPADSSVDPAELRKALLELSTEELELLASDVAGSIIRAAHTREASARSVAAQTITSADEQAKHSVDAAQARAAQIVAEAEAKAAKTVAEAREQAALIRKQLQALISQTDGSLQQQAQRLSDSSDALLQLRESLSEGIVSLQSAQQAVAQAQLG